MMMIMMKLQRCEQAAAGQPKHILFHTISSYAVRKLRLHDDRVWVDIWYALQKER
jgi:hypothetical protein